MARKQPTLPSKCLITRPSPPITMAALKMASTFKAILDPNQGSSETVPRRWWKARTTSSLHTCTMKDTTSRCPMSMQEEYYVTYPWKHLIMALIMSVCDLVGKMVLELGDSCVVRCRTSDLVCELDFKTKVGTHLETASKGVSLNRCHQGFFSGQYNSVSGKVKKESTGEVLYEISGQWSSEIYIKMAKVTNTAQPQSSSRWSW